MSIAPDGFHDHTEPTWFNQLAAARQLPFKELVRYARVSTDNRHFCHDCFCCACVEVVREKSHLRF